MKKTKLNRRQFITGISSAGAMSLVPYGILNSFQHDQIISKSDYIKALIEVLDDPKWPLTLEDIEEIKYAVTKMNPQTHIEIAIVAGFARTEDYKDIIDEYARRRGGVKAQYPDHPLFSREWLPDTYRMLLFREQVTSLLQEIMNPSYGKASDIFSGLIKRKENTIYYRDNFVAQLADRYKNELNSQEINTIHEALLFYAPYSRQFAYSYVLADRVFSKVKHSRG